MRYTIQRYAGDNLLETHLRSRQDAAVICFERVVYEQVKVLAGLDTVWGKRAVAASLDVRFSGVDLVSVPVSVDHRVTFKRMSGNWKLNKG